MYPWSHPCLTSPLFCGKEYQSHEKTASGKYFSDKGKDLFDSCLQIQSGDQQNTINVDFHSILGSPAAEVFIANKTNSKKNHSRHGFTDPLMILIGHRPT